ncbi:PilZ domain-containing protein [Noviherbaspirillum galbum]|uniref:PilZ domain-containing protein n=1 Tax=Noviherbaspirillum galbum TaxID=2709383 RepID=A0A6B3SXQ1_9BURK|nr:PilZ domain-containing protein [Noviherbaspirillum galbum]NEX63946.1 PilZ domain-containing protein [Noviherbaspirillum galbum]
MRIALMDVKMTPLAQLPHELRRYPRKEFEQSAKILVQGSAPMECRTMDISAGGIAAVVRQPIPVGNSCVLAMETHVDFRNRRINVWGKVVYCCPVPDGFRIGIEHRDYDSMSRMCLQQLCAA